MPKKREERKAGLFSCLSLICNVIAVLISISIAFMQGYKYDNLLVGVIVILQMASFVLDLCFRKETVSLEFGSKDKKKALLRKADPARHKYTNEGAREELRAGLKIMMRVAAVCCVVWGFVAHDILKAVICLCILGIAFMYADYIPHARLYAERYDAQFILETEKPNSVRGLARIYLKEYDKTQFDKTRKEYKDWLEYEEDENNPQQDECIKSILRLGLNTSDNYYLISSIIIIFLTILFIIPGFTDNVATALLKNVSFNISLIFPITILALNVILLVANIISSSLWKKENEDIHKLADLIINGTSGERFEKYKKDFEKKHSTRARGIFSFCASYMDKELSLDVIDYKYKMLFTHRLDANRGRFWSTVSMAGLALLCFLIDIGVKWIPILIIGAACAVFVILFRFLFLDKIGKRKIIKYCEKLKQKENMQHHTFGDFIDESKRHKLNRPITGIIQEDRIWEQWYDPAIFSQKLPKMSQKDFLFRCIGDDDNRMIINNRGMKTFTVRQFKEIVFKYEKAFTAMQLEKGDVICTVGLTTPEMYAIKYSATSLGLILCNLNVFDVGVIDDGKNRLFRQLENVSPKMIFTLDMLEDKIYPVINDPKFRSAVKVSMPLEYSTPKWNPERLAIGLKVGVAKLSGRKVANSIPLKQFLKLGDKIADSDVIEKYEEGMPCNISFTSGTTGINKPVLLSHDANNALAFQQMLGDFGWKKGTTHLALVPPFLAFWDADIVHAVLCQGGVNIIELALDYKTIPGYFKKYKPNMGVWSQYLWSSLLTLPDKELKRISQNLRHVIIGGERCEINAAEVFYNKTGIVQMTGFGASEVNTTFSITHPNCNKVGTAGIPLPFNNVKIVDEEFKDLTYNVPGRLFITGPCLMNGYYHRDDLTERAIHVDEKGVSWYDTGDYAVMDTDGCLTVLDRYVPPVTLKTGEKVNTLDMVEVVKKNRKIKNCKITYHDGLFVLHLSIDDSAEVFKKDAIDSILNTIQTGLPENQWPDFILLYDELPRTAVGKVDYKKLQTVGDETCEEHTETGKLKLIEIQTMED